MSARRFKIIDATHAKRTSTARHRPNSQSVQQLQRDVAALERQCSRADIAVVDAVMGEAAHDKTPMLGHTKGNTKSNRKKQKAAQLVLLAQTRDRLERLLLARGLQPCTLPDTAHRDETSNSSDSDSGSSSGSCDSDDQR